MKKTYIGGQALFEGVMMRGRNTTAMAVRDETGVIRIETSRIKNPNSVWKKIPIVRGVVAFFASLILGMTTILRSSEVFMEDDKSKATDEKKGGGWLIFFTVLLSVVLAVGLFFFLPDLIFDGINALAGGELQKIAYGIVMELIIGVIRILLFVCYILATSLMKEIKRTYMYHGAEHRTISCYEAEMELTVENVQKCTTVHDRCGTSFMFFVMFVAILVFALANVLIKYLFPDIAVDDKIPSYCRLLIKLPLLPIIAGLSYELLKLLSKTNFILIRPLKWPGLMLQRLTTKTPDDDMAEVAIAAFNAVLEREDNPEVPDLKFPGQMKLREFKEKLVEMLKDSKHGEPSDIDWILCDVTNLKRNELKAGILISAGRQIRAEKLLKERMTGKPLQYVLGHTEFYGRKFKVDERALVPRFETELLVEKALPLINKTDKALDLCCGSGAIGITVQLEKGCKVVCSDISEAALDVAKENAKKLKADTEFVKSDLLENIKGEFNVILCNPPYIKTADIATLDTNVKNHEPHLALDGGADGLDFYRRVIATADNHLEKNGFLIFEIGINQVHEIVRLAHGLFEIEQIVSDLAAIERIVILKIKK